MKYQIGDIVRLDDTISHLLPAHIRDDRYTIEKVCSRKITIKSLSINDTLTVFPYMIEKVEDLSFSRENIRKSRAELQETLKENDIVRFRIADDLDFDLSSQLYWVKSSTPFSAEIVAINSDFEVCMPCAILKKIGVLFKQEEE